MALTIIRKTSLTPELAAALKVDYIKIQYDDPHTRDQKFTIHEHWLQLATEDESLAQQLRKTEVLQHAYNRWKYGCSTERPLVPYAYDDKKSVTTASLYIEACNNLRYISAHNRCVSRGDTLTLHLTHNPEQPNYLTNLHRRQHRAPVLYRLPPIKNIFVYTES